MREPFARCRLDPGSGTSPAAWLFAPGFARWAIEPGEIGHALVLAGLLLLWLAWRRRRRRFERETLLARRLLRQIPDAVLLVAADGRILRMNRMPFSAGDSEEPDPGGRLGELPVFDAETARALCDLVARAAGGEPVRPLALHMAGGRRGETHGLARAARIPGDADSPDTVLLVISDTTDLDVSRRQWMEAERKHRVLIEQLPAITYTVELGKTPRTVFISPQVEAILGFSPGEWTSDPGLWARQLHPEDRDRVLKAVAESNEAFEPFDLVYRSFARDGRTVWFENRAVYLKGGNGAPSLVQGVMIDITARREAEAALEESEQRGLHLLKMEALGRLAGGVSHDMNNLLTPILGFGRLVRDHPDLPPVCREDLEEIIRAAERGAELTKQLLAFGRKQPVQVRPVNLNEIVSDMEPILLRTIGEDVALHILPCENPLPVPADETLLGQVIMNLAINARDAMPKGGKLWIETARGRVEEGFGEQFPGAEFDEFMRLTIRDSGHGMSEEVRRHLFEPFFTTKSKGAGSGLGLSISYGIVRRFGGVISVDTEPGQGTAFHLFLPAAVAGTAPEPGRTPESRADIPGGTETLLIAEDEHGIRRLTVRILRQLGYRVVETTDGLAALEAARRMAPPPDLLMTDVVMPRMSGPDLAWNLRRERPGLPVLFVTGFTPEDVLRRDSLDDRSVLLMKPYSQRDLARAIRGLLDGGHPASATPPS